MAISDKKFLIISFFELESALFFHATFDYFFGGTIALISLCFYIALMVIILSWVLFHFREENLDKKSDPKHPLKDREIINFINVSVEISENELIMNIDDSIHFSGYKRHIFDIIGIIFLSVYFITILFILGPILIRLSKLYSGFLSILIMFIFFNIWFVGTIIMGFTYYTLLGNKVREIIWEINKKKRILKYRYIVDRKVIKKKELNWNDIESIFYKKTKRDLYFIQGSGKKVKICSPFLKNGCDKLSTILSNFLNLEIKTDI